MPDINTTPSFFSDDPRTGALTYGQLEARRRIAAALAIRNQPYPKTIGEGLAAFGEGLGEGMILQNLDRAEAAQTARDKAALVPPSAGGATPPSVAPAIPRAPASQPAPGRTSLDEGGGTQALALAPAAETQSTVTPEQPAPQPAMSLGEFKQRLARNETGGEKNPYQVVGEPSRRGDYPYGKYQVMGENIPSWSKKYLGEELTPQQFLDSPQAQELIADGRGGEYLKKYGPTGAAAAWFAGENGMNDPNRKDTLGVAVSEYQRRFNRPLVTRDDIAASVAAAPTAGEAPPPTRVASLGGNIPIPDTPQVRDELSQSLVSQQPPQQLPPQQLPPQQLPPQQLPPQQQFAQAQPPTGQTPTQQQFAGPRVPAFPPYGQEPKPPEPTSDMVHYRRVAADPYRSDQTRQTAMQIYTEMKAAQDAEFSRRYELWKANELKYRDYEVGLPKAQEDLTAAYIKNLKEPQGIISQQPTIAQPSSPSATPAQAVPPQERTDPRLGTPQSPQRTSVPNLPPVPPGTSPEKWSELQAPKFSDAVDAVGKATAQFDDAIRAIQLARTHPGREYGLGVTGILARQVPDTDAYAFGKIVDQMVGKTFLTAYNTLKGGGQISNVEGEKAQTAQARIDPRQKPADFNAALDDLERQLRRDQEIAQRKVNMPVTAWRAAGDNSSYAPDIGERRGDHEYIGGDPSRSSSWKKVR